MLFLSSPEDGKFSGEVISCLFCGKFYEVAVQSDKNEIEAHILHEIKPGTKVESISHLERFIQCQKIRK